jgi:phosphate:Na+ symporter
MEVTFMTWFKDAPSTQIAMFHTFFNVICTCLFIPFINGFVKIAQLLIKDKKKETITTFIDDRFLKTPAVALTQAGLETMRLGKMSLDALSLSVKAFLTKNSARWALFQQTKPAAAKKYGRKRAQPPKLSSFSPF